MLPPDKANLEEYMAGIHSYDSFGRNLIQDVLKTAFAKVNTAKDLNAEISTEIHFSLRAIPSSNKIIICIKDPDGYPTCCIFHQTHLPKTE